MAKFSGSMDVSDELSLPLWVSARSTHCLASVIHADKCVAGKSKDAASAQILSCGIYEIHKPEKTTFHQGVPYISYVSMCVCIQ
jgi:hypothetical protein